MGVCSITVLILVSGSGETCVFQVIQTDSEPASESEITKMMMRKGYFGFKGEKWKTSGHIVFRCHPEIWEDQREPCFVGWQISLSYCFREKYDVLLFCVSEGFSSKQSLLTEDVRSSSCLEVSKLQIFMSKQLCQSSGEAIILLQFICCLADISPWKQRLETWAWSCKKLKHT